MAWLTLYGAVAMIVAAAAFLVGEWVRQPAVPAPDHPGALALAAGLLWPLLAAGLVQLGVVTLIQSSMRDHYPTATQPVRTRHPVAR